MAGEFPVIGKSFGTGENFSLTKALRDPSKFGHEKQAFGGRAARRAFDSTGGSKAAVRMPTRGGLGPNPGLTGRGDIHMFAFEDLGKQLEMPYDEVIDITYDPVTGEETGRVKQGFQNRDGEFVSREELGQRQGGGKHSKYTSSEQITQEMEERGPAQKRRIARAGGRTDPIEHYRRRMRAEKAHQGLRHIKEEQALLKRSRPNPRKSPEALSKLQLQARAAVPGASIGFRNAVANRLKTLGKRAMNLKNLGRKAGVLGIVATPYTTGEALVGLASKDENERLRSLEVLNGLPDFSSGRGMTAKEKKERPVYHDERTGEWGI